MEQVEFHSPTAADFLARRNQIHIWYIDLDDAVASYQEIEMLLSVDERERAERLRRELDRNRFLMGRGALRMILCHYLNIPPHLLRFRYGGYGKPAVKMSSADSIHFNLTHSNQVALLAVSSTGEVGIDVEAVHANFEMERLAKRFLSEADWQRISAAPSNKKEELFFSCWVLKEAYLKARGSGLAFSDDKARTVCHSSEDSSDNNFLVRDINGEQWCAHQFKPLPGYIAAIVSDRQWEETKYFRWRRELAMAP